MTKVILAFIGWRGRAPTRLLVFCDVTIMHAADLVPRKRSDDQRSGWKMGK
jgi:hypothetical protein